MATKEEVEAYGLRLVDAGFEVWMSDYGRTGYLVYRNTDNECWGTFQPSEHSGWEHSMPIEPSREHGSSMWVEDIEPDQWTIEAARKCAQRSNYNPIVGRHHNVRDKYRRLSGGFSGMRALHEVRHG